MISTYTDCDTGRVYNIKIKSKKFSVEYTAAGKTYTIRSLAALKKHDDLELLQYVEAALEEYQEEVDFDDSDY